jgi:glyoxylase-like metal-dependent hydrolase (beta-lactamase superfamily II)
MSAGAAEYRVFAVRYADRETTYQDAYYRWSSYGEPNAALGMSYYFWVAKPVGATPGPPIVFDTGFDKALGERMGRRALCSPGQALAALDVDPLDVKLLVISHLHYDHIGNIDLFPNARIAVSRQDFQFWAHDPLAAHDQFAPHTDPDGVEQMRGADMDGRLNLIVGEAAIAPGIVAREIGGHSPGQLIFEISGENGPIALLTDAVHYYEEMATNRPFGVFVDLIAMYRGYDTVRALVAQGATVVPGHDPAVMERFPRPDGDAREFAVCLTDRRS